MSVTIESDLKEVLAKIDQKLDKLDARFDKVDARFDSLSKDITDLKVGQARLEEKVDGLSKRMDNQEFISRGVLTGLIVAILGGESKTVRFSRESLSLRSLQVLSKVLGSDYFQISTRTPFPTAAACRSQGTR
ncbi:MAG TPA: hypothetical protein V6D12_21155 [Candidatus Obscuribacterales bacterium]